MAYFKLHAYDADVWIPQFVGLNQADVGLNGNPVYASEEENLETPRGVLQPQAPIKQVGKSFTDRIETLAVFHRRWYEGTGGKNWLIVCSAGKLYCRQIGGVDNWLEITPPAGITTYNKSTWSWVTYEDSSGGSTVDVMMMSNDSDGMIMIVPPDRDRIWNDYLLQDWDYARTDDATWKDFYSPAWMAQTVTTAGYNFGVIARYAERIWGGAIPGEPDTLVYSAPYNPTDWTSNPTIPEDGAGAVMQPSWDGDSFTALKAFGDQMIAFKQNRVWRVQGTDPGEFVFKEQYGGGAPYAGTVVAHVERILMAGKDGMSSYDGMSVTDFMRPYTEILWREINQNAMDQMCAAIYKKRYYLAFPRGDSTVNNAMLVYDLETGSILYYSDVYIESLLATEDHLYATSSSLPGVLEEILQDSWECGEASGKATRWVSPWMDFGFKRIVKGGFDIYFIPEVQDEEVTLIFSVQTEKKLKTKSYTVKPLTEAEKEANRNHRGKRLHFSGTGRRFRVILETAEGVTAPWRLLGGLQMVVETDPD